MPILGVPLGCKRLFEIRVIGEKVAAQSIRDRFAARFLEQLGICFVSKSVCGCFGDYAGVKVIIGQLEPVFLLCKEKRSIVVQGLVEAAHIQLFYRGCGWVKREAAEWSDFWHHVQEKCFEASEEAWLFIDVAPLLVVLRMRDVVDEFRLGLAGVAVLNLIFFEMPCHFGHAWNNGGNRVAVAANGQIDSKKDT